MIVATNPDAPTHWIYARLIVGGKAEGVLLVGKVDNHDTTRLITWRRWKDITGTEYQRLVQRQAGWQAEGVVHDNWDAGCQPGGRRGLAVAAGVAAHRRHRLRAGTPQRASSGGRWMATGG